MTRVSIVEYVEAVRGRYFQASKKEKGEILDEFTNVTGYHRKAAIRLIRWGKHTRAGTRRGRPQQYGVAVAVALRLAWEATDHLCSKRLHPFLPELAATCHHLNPVTLLKQINENLERLWVLADHPTHREERKAKTSKALVT